MLIAPGGVLLAQHAGLTGVVRDPNGGVLPGVAVTIIPQSGGPIRRTTGGSDGVYRFDRLPDGVYRVDFDLPGFELVRRNRVLVSGDKAANIDAELHLRAICECLTVETPTPWAQRLGQVIDNAGHPLPHARVEVVGYETATTDSEGRFLVRVPASGTLTLTATDTGFRSTTEHVSGDDAATVVLSLEHVGITGVPDVQRFGGCQCQGRYLFPDRD